MPATQQQINYGAVVNDGQGDPLRTAFIKTDNNFDAIWAAGPVGSNVTITNNTITATNTNGELRLQTNGTGNVRIARPFIPTGNRLYDLGAANLRFGTVYANTLDTINFSVSTLTVNNIQSDDSAFVQISDGLDVNGNVSAQYFIGDGSQLTNLPGGGGDYGNSNVAAYLSTGVAVNIVPAANAVWSLGNATNQWANLWVSNNTIYIGNVAVGITEGNVLTVDGYPVLTSTANGLQTNIGNFVFNVNALENLQGASFDNGDLEHNWTARLSLPGNGNLNPALWQNIYGNISIGAGANAVLTGSWVFDNTGTLTAPGNITANYFIGNGSGLTGISTTGDYTFTGTTMSADEMLIQSTDGDITIQSDSDIFADVTNQTFQILADAGTWIFDGGSGATTPPILTVARGDTSSGTITGFALKIGDGTNEAIITTPDGGEGDPNSQRIVINPGKGADSSSGEGGDIYLWAGRGGDAGGSGGDVKIRGGQGMVNGAGGYIRMEGGDGQGFGQAGYITMDGGSAVDNDGGYLQFRGGYSQNNDGGYIEVRGGYSTNGEGGDVNIIGGGSDGGQGLFGNIGIQSGNRTWTFDNTGNMTAPGLINVGNMSIGELPGYITAEANIGIVVNVSGSDGGFVVDYLKEDGNANTSQGELAFGAETGNATYRISLTDDAGNGFATKIWRFYGTGTTSFPDNALKTSIDNDLSIVTESLPTEPPSTIEIVGADFVAVNLTYNKDGANSIWYPAGYNPATDPYIEFTGGQYGIWHPAFGQPLYVNTGTLNVPLAQWNTNPPLGSVAPTGVYTYPNTYTQTWTFDTNGNLTLPGNTFAVNYANGTQVPLGGGGGANTGNVTFNNQVVQGTGTEDGGGGLYLAPGANSTGNLQYLRVRGGDYITHIHLDTGNNNYFDQYFGADSKYVKLEANGNIVINADDDEGNSATWTFDTDGTLTAPGNITAGGLLIDTVAGITANAGNVTINQITGLGGNLNAVGATVTGNISAGNLSAGQLSLSGNVLSSLYVDGNIECYSNSFIEGSLTVDSLLVDTVGGITANAGNVDINEVTGLGGWLNATGAVFTGNITAGNFLGGGSNVDLVAGAYTTTFDNTGNVAMANGTVSMNNLTVTGVATLANTATVTSSNYAIGYRDIPQVTFSANATAALADAGKHYYSTTAGNLALTLPDNSSVAFPTGTALIVVVNAAGNVLVNQGTGVTLYQAGGSSTGNRVVGAYGLATVMKVAANTWVINGTGVY